MRICSYTVATMTLCAGLASIAGSNAFAQTAPPAATPNVAKGMPPRNNTAEYMSRGQIGAVSIGAEFDRHSVPTATSILSTEDYVAVEVGLFGAPGTHLAVSDADFTLRINGKKSGLPVEQYAAVFRNLRDPNWVAPEVEAAKKAPSSNGLNTGGGGGGAAAANDNTPPVVHIPPAMERAMSESVRNAALPEGDRALPVAGLLFFRYGGGEKGIHSVELVYSGPAGKATIALQP